MNSRPSPFDEFAGPVEPGFADLPAYATRDRDSDALESGVRALLQGPSGAREAGASERLPPGRRTRPGEH